MRNTPKELNPLKTYYRGIKNNESKRSVFTMAKKDFKISEKPALAFISKAETQKTDNKHNTDKMSSTLATEETKSKRLNLLLYPSLLKNLKKIATMQ